MIPEESSCFSTVLLDKIRSRQNDAISMLDANLAKMIDHWGTLLHYTASCGNEMVAQQLIKLGSEIDIREKDKGETPVMIAIKRGHMAVAKVLLDANANMYALNCKKKTVLQMVFDPQKFNLEIVETCLRRMQIRIRSPRKLVELLLHTACTPFHVTYLRDIEVMNCMLERGFDLSSKGPRKWTVLHAAVSVNDLKMVRWLTYRGADINAIDADGKSPLFIAATYGKTEIVQFLLDSGANPKIPNIAF